MGSPRITESQKEAYRVARRDGNSIRRASQMAKVSEAWAKGYEKDLRNSSGREWRDQRQQEKMPGPIPLDEVCDEALEALHDRTGRLWAKRYWGMDLEPWQAESTSILWDLWLSEDREFYCQNGPPGGGKSLTQHVFASQITAMDRAVRGLWVSRTAVLAERNSYRVRLALERTTPMVGAAATIAGDFGRFKPVGSGGLWTRPAWIVEQMDGSPTEQKEPTWSSFGFDSEYIGFRPDIMLCDDLDSMRSIRSMDIVMANRDTFDGELEPRLERQGLMAVIQQRLGPWDFTAHVLGKEILAEEDGSGDEIILGKKYRHISYKAHYDDRCQGAETHKAGAPAYPAGCLLSPRNLPWRDLRKAMENPERFAVVYQQEEVDPADVLVSPMWVRGGIDPKTGEQFPGCWDTDRGECELPKGLTAPVLSVVTCDPSVANYWAFQWWIVHPASQQRFLMDLERRKMAAELLLDWRYDEGRWNGLMHDWQLRSVLLSAATGMNLRITHWIVEEVGAFHFLNAFDHTRRWKREHEVTIIPQKTHSNKRHQDLGITSVGPHWKYGRVRLPGKQQNPGRYKAMKLVDEVTHYRLDGRPNGTDDQVDANWFLEWNLPGLLNTLPKPRIILPRPSFVTSSFEPQPV